MAAVGAKFEVSEEMVQQVYGEVAAGMPVDQLLTEEKADGHMQPGMEAFEAGIYTSALPFGGTEMASGLRVGQLLAHRILRIANENKPLPQDIDVILAGLAGKYSVSSMFTPELQEYGRQEVSKTYTDNGSPAVGRLLDAQLQRPPSLAGAVLIFGMHMPMVAPKVTFTVGPELTNRPLPSWTGQQYHGWQPAARR